MPLLAYKISEKSFWSQGTSGLSFFRGKKRVCLGQPSREKWESISSQTDISVYRIEMGAAIARLKRSEVNRRRPSYWNPSSSVQHWLFLGFIHCWRSGVDRSPDLVPTRSALPQPTISLTLGTPHPSDLDHSTCDKEFLLSYSLLVPLGDPL